MQLHGWFKPRFRFTVDGQSWLTDGRVALAVSPDAVPADLEEHTGAHRTVDDAVRIILPENRHRQRTENGYAFFSEGPHYQAHYLDICEAAHPGMTWRMTNELEAPNLVGFHGAKVVALVAGMLGETGAPVYPPCPECNGKGGPECSACEGSGVDECVHCGREGDCDDCNGDGFKVGACDRCGGTGQWEPADDEAAA